MLLAVKYITALRVLFKSDEPHKLIAEACVMETLLAGGILMIPLGLCAVLSLTFILERVWVLSRIPDEQAAQQTLEEAERALADRGQEAAAQLLRRPQRPSVFHFCLLAQAL